MREKNRLTLSQWLKQRRKELDLTQKELADHVGCSVMTIRKFENNSRRPSKQIANLLADALAFSPIDREAFLESARQMPQASHSHLTNLPHQASPFVGRQKELEEIRTLLFNPDCRLLTLVGPGGIGKTRLAIQAADSLMADYPQGVYLVPLASLHSPAFIVYAIAKAIGFTFFEQTDPQTQLIDYLREKKLLLVLDNFEHLLAGAGLLSEILIHAPYAKMLVTSWAYLNMKEEWFLHIQGLDFPENHPLKENGNYKVEGFDAVQLFIQSARYLQPAFSLEADRDAVIHICQYVSGMPLAIELAAGWLSTISCSQIAAHVIEDIDFLQGASPSGLDRHQSLRAIFERTWKLLSPDERAVFRQLSVFRSSFTLEAAQSVARASPLILKNLVGKSLISTQAEGRYTIHEFLRQYAYEQLVAFGELATTKAQFISFFVSLAKQSESTLKTSRRVTAVQKLNAEIDHLRLIRAWARNGDVSLDDEVALLGAPWIYWSWYERHVAETSAWGDEILARMSSLSDAKTLTIYYTIGSISYSQGRYEYGLDKVTASVALSRERNDQVALAYLLAGQGITLLTVGQPTPAFPLLEESIRVTRAIGEEWFLPIPLVGLAQAYSVRGDLSRANALFSEALEIAEKHEHEWEIGIVLYFASECSLAQGDYRKARDQVERAIALQRDTDQLWALANLLDAFGHISRLDNDLEQAESAFQESLELYRYLGNQRNVANLLLSLSKLAFVNQQPEQGLELLMEGLSLCLAIDHISGLKSYFTMLADYLMAQGQFKPAAYLLGAAEKFSNRVYDPLHAHQLFETAYDYAAARSAIAQTGYLDAWEQGANMPAEQILKTLALYDLS